MVVESAADVSTEDIVNELKDRLGAQDKALQATKDSITKTTQLAEL
jgi:hypothetical protein